MKYPDDKKIVFVPDKAVIQLNKAITTLCWGRSGRDIISESFDSNVLGQKKNPILLSDVFALSDEDRRGMISACIEGGFLRADPSASQGVDLKDLDFSLHILVTDVQDHGAPLLYLLSFNEASHRPAITNNEFMYSSGEVNATLAKEIHWGRAFHEALRFNGADISAP